MAATLTKADLVITSGVPTVTLGYVRAGQAVQLPAWRVSNAGADPVGSFSNGFYLSTDAAITPGDIYLGGNSNSSLAAGGSFNWSSPTLTIPAATAPGKYYIGILVDRANAVAETNETNNYVSVPLAVEPPLRPDLVITNGPPTVTPLSIGDTGGRVTLSGWTVANQGPGVSGSFRVAYYLSRDAVFSDIDLRVSRDDSASSYHSISGLAAGASLSREDQTLQVYPPGRRTLPLGSSYILVVVDDINGVIESNESNNTVSVPLTIVSTGQ
jgi:subtilase family serine protease